MKPSLIDLKYILSEPIHVKEVVTYNNPLHFHSDYELAIIEEGYGTRIIGDSIRNFTSLEVVFMGPGLPHIWYNDDDIYHLNNPHPIKATVIYLKKAWTEEIMANIVADEDVDRFILNASRGLQYSGLVAVNVQEKVNSLKKKKGIELIIELLQVISLLSKSSEFTFLASVGYKNDSSNSEAVRMQKVYEFIVTNFHKPIKLKEVADVASMSPNSFCKYFKTHTQKTLTNYINEVRISYATKLLMEFERTVLEVSMESGFHNLTNFNKFFKKMMNCTPSEYRKNLQKSGSIQNPLLHS